MRDAMAERATRTPASDEELYEVLIAISVVAKQLARKLMKQEEVSENHEQNERTLRNAGRAV